MERPLDTIRSFEKAIDEGYKRRSSYVRQDSQPNESGNEFASRRSSSYFGSPDSHHRPSPSGGGYYGNGGYYNPTPRGGVRHGPGPRMASEPQPYNRPYHSHGYHQSHDTVNTSGGNSDSTGPWGAGTDPTSSENSSIERGGAVMGKNGGGAPDGYAGAYGSPNGYQGPIMEDPDAGVYGENYHAGSNGNGYANGNGNGYYGVGGGEYANSRNGFARAQNSPVPARPAVEGSGRKPIQLGGGGGGDGYPGGPTPGPLPTPSRPAEADKRASWLKRRFSKKA